jgi:toxin FitB
VILLDTNVVSEPWRPQPDRRVIEWLNAQDRASLYLCTPVLAELYFDAERLPSSRRRFRLESHIHRLETVGFKDRIMAFDVAAASAFGRVAVQRQTVGRRIEPFDAMIAAIALVHGFQVATRDINDFAELGLILINPFDASVTR